MCIRWTSQTKVQHRVVRAYMHIALCHQVCGKYSQTGKGQGTQAGELQRNSATIQLGKTCLLKEADVSEIAASIWN